MTYKISVFKDRLHEGSWDGRYMPWWIKFLESHRLVDSGDKLLTKPLAEWNCKNIAESEYIEFSSEADATLFLLRFS
jgi:hypothetical protein